MERLNKDGSVKTRETKSVSFNLTETFEVDLLEHAEAQGNFSKYIKRLIFMDKEGWGNAETAQSIIPVTPIVRSDDEENRKRNMNSLLNI